MEDIFKECLWKNFAAAIDMLGNVIVLCPDELWQKEKKFFYMTYHTVIFLDYYLTNPVKNFQPALPYTITEESKLPQESIDDVIPNRFYTRQELMLYLSSIREKCKNLITFSSEQKMRERWIKDSEIDLHGLCPNIVINYSVLEILFYNFRHVQHHVAQLNLLLRQEIDDAPDWVSHSK